jgi:putative MFS transporter
VANFADAAESACLAQLLPVLAQDLGSDSDEGALALVPALTQAGSLVGVIVCSWAADVFGRRPTFIASMASVVLFGLASSVSERYCVSSCSTRASLTSPPPRLAVQFAGSVTSFALLRGMVGFGYAGNLVVGFILLSELLSADTRARKVFVAGIGYGLGAVVITLVAWSVLPSLGWRWLLRIASAIGLPCVLLLIWVPESPRFHLARRDFDACVRVMEDTCLRSGAELPAFFTADKLAAAHSQAEGEPAVYCFPSCSGEASLLRWVVLRTMLPLACIFFTNGFVMTLLVWTPMASSSIFPAQQDTVFFVQLDIAVTQLLTSVIIALTAEMLPRLLQMRLTTALLCATLASLGLASKYRNYAAFLTCVALVTFTVEGVWSILFVYTPEAFPTRLRATAFAIGNVASRLAPIAAPYAVVALEGLSFALTCAVFALIVAIQLVFSFLLTLETSSRALIEESELAGESVRTGDEGFQVPGRTSQQQTV